MKKLKYPAIIAIAALLAGIVLMKSNTEFSISFKTGGDTPANPATNTPVITPKSSLAKINLPLLTPAKEVPCEEVPGVVTPDIDGGKDPITADETSKRAQPKIQVALLLDTSNSMDGLIEQAKAQLWTLVNGLTNARQDGASPNLEIALFEYGKSTLSDKTGYVRMVSGLTKDLDRISEELFKLNTDGGEEYCGKAILDAATKLEWSGRVEDLKLIFISGNEPFNQGPWNFNNSLKISADKGIVVNTIFCGSEFEGRNTFWDDGALAAGGQYMNIDHNAVTTYNRAPQDSEIQRLNSMLNETYVPYGSEGVEKKERLVMQDTMSVSYGRGNIANRAFTKSSQFYSNEEWDLVDAMDAEDMDLDEVVATAKLPKSVNKKDKDQVFGYLERQKFLRDSISTEIKNLYEQRQEYVEEAAEAAPEMQSSGDLNRVMMKSIRKQGKAKKFTF